MQLASVESEPDRRAWPRVRVRRNARDEGNIPCRAQVQLELVAEEFDDLDVGVDRKMPVATRLGVPGGQIVDVLRANADDDVAARGARG